MKLILGFGVLFCQEAFSNVKHFFLLPATAEQIGSSFVLSGTGHHRSFGFLANPSAMQYKGITVGYGHVFTDPIENLGPLNGSEYEGIGMVEIAFMEKWSLGFGVHMNVFEDVTRDTLGVEGERFHFTTSHMDAALGRRWNVLEHHLDVGVGLSYLLSWLNHPTIKDDFTSDTLLIHIGCTVHTPKEWQYSLVIKHVLLPYELSFHSSPKENPAPRQYAFTLSKILSSYLTGSMAYSLIQEPVQKDHDFTNHVALALRADVPLTNDQKPPKKRSILKQVGGGLSYTFDVAIHSQNALGASFYIDLNLLKNAHGSLRLQYAVRRHELLGYLQGVTMHYHFE